MKLEDKDSFKIVHQNSWTSLVYYLTLEKIN